MLTKNEAEEFCKKNKYATLRIFESIEDYLGARICLLNGLPISGMQLSCQAIEKILKASIFLIKGSVSNENKSKHDVAKLKIELNSNYKFDLNKYDDLFNRLYGHYQWRYLDNKNKSRGMGTNELNEIDELYINLCENLSLPDELKYKTGLYSYFVPWFNSKLDYRVKILLDRNLALNKILDKIRSTAILVDNYWYPKINAKPEK